MYSPPRVRDGRVWRGVLTCNHREIVDRVVRDHWVVLHCDHWATVPPARDYVDLWQIDASWERVLKGSRPYVLAIFRDFTDPTQFFPTATEKQYDVLFNACWAPVKRHGLFLDALDFAKRRGRPISALFCGYHWKSPNSPGTDVRFEHLTANRIAAGKLPARIVSTCWDPAEMNRRYNLCRCALLCSLSEAGPRVLAEAALADIPYITTRDTRGGSPQHVARSNRNGLTCAATPQGLAEAVWAVIDRRTEFHPREWALGNMCRPVAESRLRAALQRLALQRNWRINLEEISGTSGTPTTWADPIIHHDQRVRRELGMLKV